MHVLLRLSFFIFLACLPGYAYSTEYTVGNFYELNTALSSSGTGDVICLNDGVYQISGVYALEVNTENLTIKGKSGIRENVIVQGEGMYGDVNHGFFVCANHVTIEGMTIQNVSNHGIQTDVNTDYLHVNNCIFRDTYEQMLKVPYNSGTPDPSENGIVENCLFEYSAGEAPNWYTGGVDVHSGKDWIVRKNTFRDIQSPGDYISEHAVHFWTGSQATVVEQNLIINCDRGIGFGLGTSPHFGGIIRNNMIYHDGSGEFPDVGIGIESSSDTFIYNNTIIMNHSRYDNAIEYRFNGTTNAYIANNLTNKLIVSRDEGTGTVENNLTTAQLSWFVSPAAGDLHLADKISEVINQGIPVSGLTDDYDGDRRPLLGGIDLGADEYRAINIIPQILLLLTNNTSE